MTGKIFICYNRQDKQFVEQIASCLQDERFDLWYDKHSIIPGDEWIDEIQKGLNQSSIALICIGKHGISDGWQRKEITLALNRQVKKKINIVPVLLPGCTDKQIPESLSIHHFIRFNINSITGFVQSINNCYKQNRFDSIAPPNSLKTTKQIYNKEDIIQTLNKKLLMYEKEMNTVANIDKKFEYASRIEDTRKEIERINKEY